MLEEKSVKHWLKRKVKVTEALLVAFLITGGIASAEETVSKAEFDALKTKVEALEKNGTNYVTILSTSEENKVAPSEGEDVVNIGTNQIGEKNKEQHYVTVVGTSNKIKNFRITPDDVKPDSIEESHAYGETVFGNGNTVADGVIIGRKNIATGSSGVVLGENSENYGNRSINIGTFNMTYGTDSIAMGFASKALGTSALALGGYAEAKTVGAIAIGDSAIAEKGVALGYNSLADRSGGEVGYYPEFGTTEREAIAKKLGKEAEYKETMKVFETSKELIEKEREYYSVIAKRDEYQKQLNEQTVDLINYNKDAQKYKDAVAKILEIKTQYKENKKKELELGKIVSTDNPEYKKLNDARSTYGNIFGAYSSTMSAVSVGNEKEGIYRQITGVAAGSKDTDAVNVAQLKSLNTKVDKGATHYYSVNSNKVGDDSNYKNNGATGDDAIAIGIGVKAKGQHAIAMGNNVESSGYASIAIGKDSEATKQGAIAIGKGAKVYAGGGVAIGTNVQAGDSPSDGDWSPVALGYGTKSTGGASTAFGYESVASGAHAIAGGDRSKATGQDSVALGQEVEASGTWSVALGQKTVASASNSMAMGENTKASGSNSTAMGIKTEASGAGSTAMGYGTKAIGDWSLATGVYSKSEGEFSTAMGLSSIASGYNSFAASGANVEKEASNAIAMGYNATAKLTDSVALGSGSVASTKQGVAGYNPITDKNYERTPEAAAAYQKWIDAYNAWEAIDETEKDKKTEKLKECNAMKEEYNKLVSTWESTKSAIAVGDKEKGISRQITGVAAGREDTDAVNVAQLKSLNTKVDKGATHYYSVNDMNDHVDNYKNDGAKGVYSTVAGPGSTIKQTNNQMFQGATSAILGSFNTIDAGDKEFDGVANSIVGVANTTKDANGSLIFGAGNKITNSYRGVDFTKLKGNGLNLSDSQSVAEALGKLVANSGGSVLAIGGANTADYATLSKVIGVGNTLKGSAQNESTLNMIDGFKNTGTNIKNTTIVGSENTVENGSSNILIGDKHKLKKVSNSVILGSTEQETETTVSDVVSIGHNAKVEKKGGIALGSSSVANREKGKAGFDISTNLASTNESAIWKATHSALSIGNGSTVTRQITGVAAGRADTDAVNVAQLKSLGKKVETDYAKVDASNLSDKNVTSWKTKLGVSDLTSTLLTYKANGEGNQKVSLATGLNFTNGENTTASIDENGVVKYDVNKELKNMISIAGKDGEGKISFGKDAKNNKPTVNVNNSRITGVTAGTESTDAVNKGQLDTAVKAAVEQVKDDIKVNAGEGISVQKDKGTFTVSLDEKTKATLAKVGTGKIEKNNQNTVTGDTVYNAIKDLKGDISAAKTEVKGSEQIEVVEGQTSDGHALYKVKAKTEELKVKDGKIEKPTNEKALVTAGNIAKVIEETELTTTVKSGSKNITLEEKKIGNNTEYTMDLAKDISVDSIKIGDKISISKSGINAGKQKITNVADGKADSDAANMKQLRKVEENAKKDAEKLGNAINHNAQKIHDLKKEVGNVGALSSAMAALNPMEYDPMKPNQVLAGVGSYKNSQAVAVGMSHHFNENLRVQAGVSVSEGRKTESMVNLGLAWKIGKDDRDDSYNKYKEGPISSIYVMQDEMKQVMEENKNLKSEVEEMKKQLQTLIKQK